MSKNSMILLLILMVPVSAICSEYFIPHSPLTVEELEDAKKSLATDMGWTEEDVEKYFDGDPGFFTYRDEDVRAAFPELLEGDEQLSLCSNSIMMGATQVIFLSTFDDKHAVIKSATCRPEEKGLRCEAMDAREKYYYGDPKVYFEINGDITYEEAAHLMSVFERSEIKNLPDWYKGFDYSTVKKISKTENGYRLFLGELFCMHCVAELEVKLEKQENKEVLVLLEVLDGMCV